MVNYSKAKIYKIVDNTNGNIYIGSTCKTLTQRLSQHKYDYKMFDQYKKYTRAFKILENGDFDIILLEEFKTCENKEQLHARERFYIDSLVCVNKNIPSRTKKEYTDSNKDKNILRAKTYYENNKEIIKTTKNSTIFCGCCNCFYTHSNRARHFKSQKHIENSKQPINGENNNKK